MSSPAPDYITINHLSMVDVDLLKNNVQEITAMLEDDECMVSEDYIKAVSCMIDILEDHFGDGGKQSYYRAMNKIVAYFYPLVEDKKDETR